jgi:hypothetical protein
MSSKLTEFREVIKCYLKNIKAAAPACKINPEKPLRKLLTTAFKELHLSNRSNLLEQLYLTARNLFGEVVF